MNTKELKSSKLFKEYSLEIPYEEIDIEVDNKINQILPTVNIPGFRKGKAPLNIVTSILLVNALFQTFKPFTFLFCKRTIL